MYTAKDCFECSLGRNRINIVNGRETGDNPKILILGEAPGAEEDKTGLPFQGKSGILLEKVLLKAGVPVHITNCIRCRPPDNRNPTTGELASCRNHLQREVEEFNPSAIVTVGRIPLDHMMWRTKKASMISLIRTAPHDCYFFDNLETIPLYPMYHPSYILRNQSKMVEYIAEFATLLKEINND